MVRPGAFAHPVELVHNDLGILDYCVPQNTRISGGAIGRCLLVAWDLLLDPAMNRVTSYWIWGEQGSYYGMPWTNLLGWAITGFQ
ncbi:MAG TPA: carotenoid biosynthesis protein [Pyrinomonadaceae bacterium]|nr:carotenoid biosynthesis protein [Pyrinomonadaceae bacterium]